MYFFFNIKKWYFIFALRKQIFSPKIRFMNINVYHTLAKKNSFTAQIATLVSEPFVLSLLAAVGLIGTIFMFKQNPNQAPSNAYAIASVESNHKVESIQQKDDYDFDKMVKISGKEKAGEELEFNLIFDRYQRRFVMEMGDGMRVILTRDKFTYVYKEKGTYLLEIKEINSGVINTVASKKLKIK